MWLIISQLQQEITSHFGTTKLTTIRLIEILSPTDYTRVPRRCTNLGSFCGVRLIPVSTHDTSGSLVPVSEDRWELAGEFTVLEENLYFSATSSTTNPTLYDLGSNRDLCGGSLATNYLRFGTVSITLLEAAWELRATEGGIISASETQF
jgi:hypothetical protein